MDKIETIITGMQVADINRFCTFWHVNSIVWEYDSSPLDIRVRELVAKVDKNSQMDGNTLYITENYQGEWKIPFTQFVYEVNAFACLNSNLDDLISFNGFRDFIISRVEYLEKQEWQVEWCSNPIFPAINSLRKDSKLAINTNKVFRIHYYGQMEQVYDPDLYWVQDVYLQELIRVYLMDVIVHYYKDLLEPHNVSVISVNWNWALNNCLYPGKVTSSAIANRKKYLLGNLANHIEKEESFLESIYGDYTIDLLDELFNVPEKIMPQRGMLRHVDTVGNGLNVIAGRRLTTDCPSEFDNTVYLFGGCVFFGYAERDEYTVASCLQRILNARLEKSIRVVNMACWGGNIDEEHMFIPTLRYKAGDVIIISYAGLIPIGDDWERNDISIGLGEDKRIRYFNSLVHCNRYGYERVASNIYTMYKPAFQRKNSGEYFDLKQDVADDADTIQMLQDYYGRIKHSIPHNKPKAAAIVMNCNPFTFGHRYLIEQAAAREKCLYIFVVEENKSDYSFEERLYLVKECVRDLKNVIVLPSGNLMISAKTFPEYFTKKEKNTLSIDPSNDVYIFARLICPLFNICRRYVGEEPIDLVTRRYNDVMREILPTYGVDFVEIPRKDDGHDVISASRVRKYAEIGDWERLESLAPKETIALLKKKVGRNDNKKR